MPSQAIDPESYFEGAHIWESDADPSDLSAVDFYWWSIEQAEGSLEKAVYSLDSPQEAFKFTVGMQQDKVSLAQRAHCGNNEVAIGGNIISALTDGVDEFGGDSSEVFRTNQIWVQALNEFFGVTDELYESAGQITAKLDEAIKLVSSARTSLEAIVELSEEVARNKFSYTKEDLHNLNLLAEGTELNEHMEDAALSRHEAKNRRKQSVKKLGVNTTPHAIRIGIEEGLVGYENPTDEEPAVKLNEFDVEVLELYSRGVYVKDIAVQKGVSAGLIGGRLSQMALLFSAKKRWQIIKRGFELGVITPDRQTHHHQLRENLRIARQVEHTLLNTREYMMRFIGLQGPQTDPAAQPGQTPAPKDMLDPNQVWIQYQRAQENMAAASETTAHITDSIFDLLKRTHSSMKPVVTPFTETEKTELKLASEGVRLSARTSAGAIRKTITDNRLNMLEKAGTKSFAYLIGKMIESGYLQVDWTHPENQTKIVDPLTLKLLSAASEAAGRPDELDNNSTIAAAVTGHSDQSIRPMIRQVKELLGSSDWASLMRRAFEEGVLINNGPLGNLQKAQQSSALIRPNADRTRANLSTIPAEEIVARLFPMPPRRKGKPLSPQLRNELLQLAAGASVKDRAKSEQIKSLDTIRSRRSRLNVILGTRTMAEAVEIGIRTELIPLKLKPKQKSALEIDPYMVDVFFDLSRGALVQEIAKRKGMPPSTLSRQLSVARKNISADSNEHAIKRLYEERYFSID